MFIVPGKKESWQRNRAIELVSVHVIVPAIKPGTPPGNMKFALLGSDDQGPNDLPTRLVGSSTLALSRVFPNNKPQTNRDIVLSALSFIKRKSKEAEGQDDTELKKYISNLETRYLGSPRSHPDSVPQTSTS